MSDDDRKQSCQIIIYAFFKISPLLYRCTQAFSQTLETGRPGGMFSHKSVRD